MSIEKRSIGREAAIAMAETKWWENKSAREIALTQWSILELCCPFSVFHKALEETLGRPVYTHEIVQNAVGIEAELMGVGKSPMMQEIIEMISEEKQISVVRS